MNGVFVNISGASMIHNLFNTLKEIPLSPGKYARYYSLPALEASGAGRISRLPISIRIVLESVLRNYDGKKITEAHVRRLANWEPSALRLDEIPFVVSRIVLQDFTGVPLLVDQPTRRVYRLRRNPAARPSSLSASSRQSHMPRPAEGRREN